MIEREVDREAAIRRLRTPLLGLFVVSILHLVALVALLGIVFLIANEGRQSNETAQLVALRIHVSIGCGFAGCDPVTRCAERTAGRIAVGLSHHNVLVACFPVLTPGLVLGIPFGIWGTFVLFMPTTAAAFDQQIQPPQADNEG